MNPPVRSKPEESTPELLPCPGKRLREAREAQKINIASAAEQLHLSRATVEALEAEDFDKLPARVFVRGYYRNYARLVGVSEETINREFKERCPDAECKGALPQVKNVKSEMRSSHGLVRIITWSIVVVLLAALVWWAKNNIRWPGSDEPEQAPPVPESTEQEQLPAPDSAVIERPLLPPAQQQAEPRPEPAVSMVDTPVETTAPQPVETPATMLPAAPVRPAAPKVQPKGKGEIKVLFDGDCWVDIRDSTRQFKLVGTLRAGDSRKLGGKPPFSIVPGDYKAVTMTIDDKPYDLSAHAQGKTAKFKLDPAAAAAN